MRRKSWRKEELVDAKNARENEEEEDEQGLKSTVERVADDLVTDGATIESKATVNTKQSNTKSKKKSLQKKGRIQKLKEIDDKT